MKSVHLLRLRLLLLLFLTTFTVLTKNIYIVIVLLLSVVLSIFLSKLKRKIITRLRPLFIMAFLIISFQILFNRSVELPTRILQGITASIKIITLSMLVFFFTTTTSPKNIAEIFSFLPKEIQLMLIITFGMITAIIDESYKITLVQNSRGHNTKRLNIFQGLLPIIIPLFHRTLKRAEQLSMVIQTRGYE